LIEKMKVKLGNTGYGSVQEMQPQKEMCLGSCGLFKFRKNN